MIIYTPPLVGGDSNNSLILLFRDNGGFFVTGDSGTNWRFELTGATQQMAPASDIVVEDALRIHLFAGLNNTGDLVSRNIQRGRDHGIPSYSALREAFGMEPVTRSCPEEIETHDWDKLMNVYASPTDIDAFTGGLAEKAPR